MKVFLLQGDQGGSGFYRVQEPARVARIAGVDVTVGADIDVDGIRWMITQNGQPTGDIHRDEVHEIHTDADVIVIQRPLRQTYHEIAKAAKRQGIKVMADLDDDFHNVHHQNVAAKGIHRRTSPLENTRWLMKTLELCDAITVSTPALLKYQLPGVQAHVVRNYLPEKILDLPVRFPTGRVGWTGTTTTHPKDLQQARGVLDQIPTPMSIVGDIEGVAENLQVPADRVHLASSWVSKVPIYWRALNGSMDVGLVPLESSTFNKSKSWLKGIEYAALGKPFIASPLPEYIKLVEESGAGVIARGPKQWATAARELLEDGDEQREAGRKWSRHHMLEDHINDWIDAWGSVL